MHRLRFTIGLLVALSLLLAPSPLPAQTQSLYTYVNLNNYFEEVRKASVWKPVMVLITEANCNYKGCEPVNNMDVVYDRLAREFKGQIKFARFELDNKSDWEKVKRRFGAKRVPSTALYIDGKMIDMLRGGPPTKDQIPKFIDFLGNSWIPTNITNPNCKWVYKFNNSSTAKETPYNACK